MNRFNRSKPACVAQIDALESRRMLNAATLSHGLLTVYGSEADNVITVQNPGGVAGRIVTVGIDGTTFSFRGTGIVRMRIFGFGGNDTITLSQTNTPNLGDVAIDAGSGNDSVTDATVAHRFNRGESVSVLGGAGNDVLTGGVHTLSLDGGTEDDTVQGGAAGAVLSGGDGNDLVSANIITLRSMLTGAVLPGDAPGAVVLNGGAGDDYIVGNSLKLANVQDTISGGDGNDAIYNFSTDQIVDLGLGLDTQPAANQFTGNADVTQTATLLLGDTTSETVAGPHIGLGNNGPNSRIFVSSNETLTMQGPTGSSFLLGELLNASGYPVNKLGLSGRGVSLNVNGFASSLSGNQIAGYQINNGDVVELDLGT